MKTSAYLYLAAPLRDERFKIGRSSSPATRLRALGLNDLDLDRSRVLSGMPSHVAKAESVLHFMLEPWRSPQPHGGDGHTEWFSHEALATVYVTDLARSDGRFTLADPLMLMTPPARQRRTTTQEQPRESDSWTT